MKKKRTARITRQDVFDAADDILRSGARPSIDGVLKRLGRGSRNTAGKYLKFYWADLHARLAGPSRLHGRLMPLVHELLGILHTEFIPGKPVRRRIKR